jgi:hypothetical protein
MAQAQNLAQAMFAVMLNASLVALQGPRMTGDAASMKKVFDSVDALQLAFDEWFDVRAGFKAAPTDLASIVTAAEITQPTPAPARTPSKIVVATEADIPKAKVYGNVPTKGKGARGPLPPTRVRTPKGGGAGDPFNPQFFGQTDDGELGIPGPDADKMAMMEKISREVLGETEMEAGDYE